jgi:predicted N-acetyltransferase YhbS
MAADAVVIRPALPSDAAGLAMLANALDRDQGGEGKVHSEATVLRAAFAAEPAVRFVVATQGAEPVGYAMFARFYSSDTAETGSYLNDLYVIPALRSAGIGRRLITAVAAATAQAGGSFILDRGLQREHPRPRLLRGARRARRGRADPRTRRRGVRFPCARCGEGGRGGRASTSPAHRVAAVDE